MIGGLSDIKKKDNMIIDLVNSVKNTFNETVYETNKFEVNSYKTQVVNGTIYYAKVETDKEYIHLKIHKSLPCNNSEINLMNHQDNKTLSDEIIGFS